MNKSLACVLIPIFVCSLALVARTISGGPTPELAEGTRELGASLERKGIMTERDFVKIRAIESEVCLTGQISASDFVWTLDLLQRSRTPFSRERAMMVLSVIRPMTFNQQAEVGRAIAPFAKSTAALDQASVARVMEALTVSREREVALLSINCPISSARKAAVDRQTPLCSRGLAKLESSAAREKGTLYQRAPRMAGRESRPMADWGRTESGWKDDVPWKHFLDPLS